MKKSMFILSPMPLGYQIDYYYYCKYLADKFDITYICVDYGYKKIDLAGVNVIYLQKKKNIINRAFYLIFNICKIININKPDLIFCRIRYSFLMPLLFIFNRKKFIYDIRTASVQSHKLKRKYDDFLTTCQTFFFNNVTVISEGVRDRLRLNKNKVYILPLGADNIFYSEKIFDRINLLYVGTLTNRNITETVDGFIQFFTENKDKIDLSYAIIGSGSDQELLKKKISDNNMGDVIKYLGPIPHVELKQYFDKSNVGVSFIPITDYYNNQPPTKTFEYLISGMATIATNTIENAKVVTDVNGVLIGDTSLEFYRGLNLINERLCNYNSKEIANSASNNEWSKIVNDFGNYLDFIIEHNKA